MSSESGAISYGAIGDGPVDELLDISKTKHKDGHGPHARVSLFIAFCLMVNYIIGVGILETPYAFAKAGVLLSIIMTLIITALMIIVVMYVLDAMARARGLANIYLLARISRSNELAAAASGATSGGSISVTARAESSASGAAVPMLGVADAKSDGSGSSVGSAEHEPVSKLVPYFGRARHTSTQAGDADGANAEDVRAAMKMAAQTEGESSDSLAKHVSDYMTANRLRSLAAPDQSGVVNPAGGGGAASAVPAGEDLVSRALGFDLEFNGKLTDALQYKYGVVPASENRMFELSELCTMFTPQWNALAYEFAILMMLYLALWSYASVFGNSFVAKFPVFSWGTDCDPSGSFTADCAWSFRLWVAIYGGIVITLSLYEVAHMLVFQVTLTVARFILIFLMFFASTVGIFHDPVDNCALDANPPDLACHAGDHAPYYGENVTMFNSSGLITVISAVLFCELVTFGVPEIITPLKKRGDSKKLLTIGMLATGAFYMVVGLCCSIYFGDITKSQINLNFDKYRGGAGAGESIPGWAQVVSYFVALFPALDVMSVFPLLAIALGNTIHARLSRYRSLTTGRFAMSDARLLTVSRLIASIPPVLGSLALRDISQIIKFAALPGVYIGFFAPPLLQYYSIQKCKAGGINPDTPFSMKVLSSVPLMIAMMCTGVATYGIVCAAPLMHSLHKRVRRCVLIVSPARFAGYLLACDVVSRNKTEYRSG